jgi:hypothetical protein
VNCRDRNCCFEDVRGIMDRDHCPDHTGGAMDDCFRDKLKGIMDRDMCWPGGVGGVMDDHDRHHDHCYRR